ncbi:MAG: imidazolonepropionase, partial [Calditrichales bacterium]
MKTLITHIGNLYTPDSRGPYGKITHHKNIALLVADGKINKIYNQPNPEEVDAAIPRIDARGMTMIPGFVDPHTHPVFWQTREAEFQMRVQGKSYEEIAAAGGGIRNSARNFRNAGKSDIKEVTRKRIRTFLEYGTTTIEAKSGYGLSLDSELMALEIIDELNKEQPLEMVPTFLGAHEVPDNYRDNRPAYIQLVIEEMILEVSRRKLAKYCDVFCETGVFSVEESRQILLAGKRNGLQIRMHADELSSSGGAELAADLAA